MKNLKEFDNYQEYKAYEKSKYYEIPNVSFCNEEEDIYYTPELGPQLIITYDVKDDNQLTQLCYYGTSSDQQPTSFFSKIETEYGEEIPISILQEQQGKYQLPLGINIIKYIPKVLSNGTLNYAFKDCTSIIRVQFSSNILRLGESLFSGCNNLKFININNILYVGSNAFKNCNFKYLKISKNCESMYYENPFKGNNLQYIIVDPDNPKYDSRDNCNAVIYTSTNSLKIGSSNTIIPDTVKSIGDYAFYGNKYLTNIEIPEGITTIGDYAFAYTNIKKFVFPSTMSTNSGMSYMFQGCTIEELTLNNNFAISRDVNSYYTLNYYCPGLKILNLSNVQKIGTYECLGIRRINSDTNGEFILPEGLTQIGSNSFLNSSWVKYVKIPESITSIGQYAFKGCINITKVNILATTPPTIGSEAFPSGTIICVPRGCEEAYRAASGWENYQIQIVP